MFYGHGYPDKRLFSTVVKCSVLLGVLWYYGHLILISGICYVIVNTMSHLNLSLCCYRPNYEMVLWLWHTLVMFYGSGDPNTHLFSTVVSCSEFLGNLWYLGHIILLFGICDVTVLPMSQINLSLYGYRPQYKTVGWFWHTMVMFYGHGDQSNHLFSTLVSCSVLLGNLWY